MATAVFFESQARICDEKRMKNFFKWGWMALVLVTPILCGSLNARADEDWKGKPENSEISLGALTGAAVVDSHVGLGLLGTASKKILHDGFVPNVTNSVSIEAELGPMFYAGNTIFWYSAHLRWDFQKNTDWIIYALGGLGGNVTPDSLGGHFELYPRFGLGAILLLAGPLGLRAEVSHEFIGAGVIFPM